jgi:hypothetical protein
LKRSGFSLGWRQRRGLLAMRGEKPKSDVTKLAIVVSILWLLGWAIWFQIASETAAPNG